MAGAKVPLTFRIFKGDQLLREERLSLSVIKLGKVPSAHLKLDDETVSRMHAIIEVNGPGDVSIIDLGSTKGTFVNGQKVNKAKLQSGDTIVVGETKIELAIGATDEEEVTKVSTSAVAAPSFAPPSAPIAAPPAFTPPPLVNPGPITPAPAPPVPVRPAAPAPAFGGMAAAPPVPAAPAFASAPAPSFASPVTAPSVRPPPGAPGGVPLYGATASPTTGFQASMAESADNVLGARAIEVAAMLGDSVVNVKHCIDPRGGKITGLTWMFLIGALVSFALSVVAFSKSINNAAANKELRDYQTTCMFEGKRDPDCIVRPARAVREHQLSFIFDLMALGGFALSIISFTVGLARARNELESPYFRVGQGKPETRVWVYGLWALVFVPLPLGIILGSPGIGLLATLLSLLLGPIIIPSVRTWSKPEFTVETMAAAEFPLVEPRGDDFVFNFLPGMEGEMIVNGQSTSLAELAAQGRTTISPIPPNAKIRVRTGKATFLVSAVPQPRRGLQGFLAAFESHVLLYYLGSAVAHGLFLLIVWRLDIDDNAISMNLALNEDTSTRSTSTSKDDPPPEEEEDKPDDGEESGGSGQAMALEEGLMGKKESDRKEGQYQMKKNQDDPVLARQQALEASRTAGVLGSTMLQRGDAFASLTGAGDLSSGFDDSNIYGGLLGNEAGEMQGGFGYGRSGFGPGGGGTGWGTIGTGRYGTIGHGSGTGTGYGIGGGRGGMRGRSSAVPPVSIGAPTTNGDLDKAIIRRYIKRNIQKIQYCYEKELLAKSNLAGVVQTNFLITPNGNVSTSTGSGVDPEVANCVANVIKGIEFPKPKNGGPVQVNYPFTFRPAGS